MAAKKASKANKKAVVRRSGRSGEGGAATETVEYEVSRPGSAHSLSFEDKESARRYAARIPGAVVHPVVVRGGRLVRGSHGPDISYVDPRQWARELSGGGARASAKTQRARFDSLRARYLTARKKYNDLDIAFSSRYGRTYNKTWLSAADRKKLENARASADKAGDAFYEYVKTISPRDWSYGVPIHWISEDLTFEDAIRPLGEKLSVSPPPSFGSSASRF